MKLLTILFASFTLLASGVAFAAETCDETTVNFVNSNYCGNRGVASCTMVSGVRFKAQCKPVKDGKMVEGEVTKATPMKQKSR